MGIIIRQSIKNSLINYLGVLIAAVSTIWIYPYDKTTYGLIQFLQAAAMTALPFLLVGANFVSIRFFPEFKNETNGHHGYFGILSILVFSGFIFFGLAYWLFEEQVAWLYSDKSDLFKAYIPYILPLTMLIGILQFCVSYATNFKRIAVPAIFTNLIKISLPVLILAHFWSYISLDQLVWGVLLNFAIAMLGAFSYLWWLGEIKWKIDWAFLTSDRKSRMLQYAAFGMASGVGGVLAFRIDAVMVPSLIDFKSNGVYNLAMFIGNAIAISSTALLAIASPIISASFRDNNMGEIRDIYKKSSINLLIAGTLFFCLILPNVADLFSIMPKSEEMAGGYWVVFFIGLTKVIEMGTSVNHQIINHSNFYRLNIIMIFFLAISNISLNWWLLQTDLGIIGAAIATCISLSIYNIVKVGIIYWKLNIQPFSTKTLWIIGITLVLFLSFSAIDLSWHPMVNIAVKSAALSLLYLPAIYFLKVSPELNGLVKKYLKI